MNRRKTLVREWILEKPIQKSENYQPLPSKQKHYCITQGYQTEGHKRTVTNPS